MPPVASHCSFGAGQATSKRRHMARLQCGQVLIGLLSCCFVSVSAVDGNGQHRASTCNGFDEEWALCKGQPACVGCVPVNCTFNEWGEWSYLSGCTELCSRSRTIKQSANVCGRSCNDAVKETKRCSTVGTGTTDMPAKCVLPHVNCLMGAWEAWAGACKSPLDQKTRIRAIKTPPHGISVDLCSGNLKETQPCSAKPPATNCILNQWLPWKQCDRTCGGGYTTRTRTVKEEAAHGGTCPENLPLAQMLPCGTADCHKRQDCIMGAWSPWGKSSHANQLRRFRDVKTAALGRGERCSSTTFEVKEAPPPAIVDCMLSPWGNWTACSASCGVGQRLRSRTISPWSGTGKCDRSITEQMEGCNTQLCGGLCTYSTWSPWGNCTNKCGDGTKTRTRSVTNIGFDCNGTLKEANHCVGTGPTCQVLAKNQDCTWGLWQEWGDCTKTCGGGSSERDRAVATPPGQDGTACAAEAMSEVRQCNPQTCHPCVNAVWEDWKPWGVCSSKCDSGLQSRERKVLQEANYCGSPAVGNEKEYKVCDTGVPCIAAVDCEISLWAEWSSCTKNCYGIMERTRRIITPASGTGTPCTDSTKEMLPCRPGLSKSGKLEEVPEECYPKKVENCSLSTWGEWSNCTAACSGTKQRLRRIKQLPTYGTACIDKALAEVTGCSTPSCKKVDCTDCKWSAWGKWGQCGQCKGQQSRSRSIVELPNYCGTPCPMRNVEETRNCTGVCPGLKYCVWEDWRLGTSCAEPSQNNCGTYTMSKTRSMHTVNVVGDGQEVFGKGDSTISCQGFQTAEEKCKDRVMCETKCNKTDCELGPWQEWSAPSCNAVCERSRGIARVSKCGGTPCKGTLSETKVCPKKGCETPRDCMLSAWSEWNPCNNDDMSSQTSKQRTIVQYPAFGGKVCSGPDGAPEVLAVTRGCWEQKPVDCKWDDWSLWTLCSQTCDGGTTTRKREMAVPVEFQGIPCHGNNKEVVSCSHLPCPFPDGAVECKFTAWSNWETGKTHTFMPFRTRTEVRPLEAKLLKAACLGATKQWKEPDLSVNEGDWTPWSKCSRSCGGGQTTRTRGSSLEERFGQEEGMPDDTKLGLFLKSAIATKETLSCNKAVCDASKYLPCTYTAWQAWTPCSSSCGPGQQKQKRGINVERGEFGAGCTEPLEQLRSCSSTTACAKPIDCVWESWSAWTICTVTCNGGEKVRSRAIKVAPDHGGKACEPLIASESTACGTQPCNVPVCQDAVWSPWTQWSNCSISCDPGDGIVGLTKRTRNIAVYANSCGAPVEGATMQHKSCTPAPCPTVNCEFDEWSPWSGCNTVSICDGSQSRQRVIKTRGSGPGATVCKGETAQTSGCSPCEAVQPVACQFSAWSTVGGLPSMAGCNVQCGGGRVNKKRHIAVRAKNGGKACDGALEETSSCNTQVCAGMVKEHCVWADWTKWGKCDVCGPTGQRTRARSVLRAPKNGGDNCETADSQQITTCDVKCGKTYCTWSDWQAYGDCTASCGPAQKARRRYLFSSSVEKTIPPTKAKFEVESVRKYEALEAHIESVHAARWQDLSTAFALGGVAFLVFYAAMRMVSRAGKRSSHSYSRMSAVDTDKDAERSDFELGPALSQLSRQSSASARDITPAASEEMHPSCSPLSCSGPQRLQAANAPERLRQVALEDSEWIHGDYGEEGLE